MPHVAPWYRREDYARVREIMADGDRFPPSFDAWKKTAKKQMAEAKREGLQDHLMMVRPRQGPSQVRRGLIFFAAPFSHMPPNYPSLNAGNNSAASRH